MIRSLQRQPLLRPSANVCVKASMHACVGGHMVGCSSGRRFGRIGGAFTEEEVAADRRRRAELISMFASYPSGQEGAWAQYAENRLQRDYPIPGSLTKDAFEAEKRASVVAHVEALLDTNRWLGLDQIHEMRKKGTLTAEQARTIVDEVEAFRREMQCKFFSGDTTAHEANGTLALYLKERVKAAKQRQVNQALASSINARPPACRVNAFPSENALRGPSWPAERDRPPPGRLKPLSITHTAPHSKAETQERRKPLSIDDIDVDVGGWGSTPEPGPRASMGQRQPSKPPARQHGPTHAATLPPKFASPACTRPIFHKRLVFGAVYAPFLHLTL